MHSYNTPKSPYTSSENSPRTAAGISPSSKAKISAMYLSQLKSLQELRASALSEEEFEEQKKFALKSIRGLNESQDFVEEKYWEAAFIAVTTTSDSSSLLADLFTAPFPVFKGMFGGSSKLL